MSLFQSQKELAMASLDEERKKSDKLLLNILPEPIANKLRNKDFNIAEEYVAATIMFVDMVNFTGISRGMTASAVVGMLNQVFTKFDDLTKKYGLEKIKTIGDAYMVAGGVPKVRADHAEAIIKMALEIQGVLAEVSASIGKDIQMRIGINSGPVIAGVIGHSKFSYDLWGDTVNLASRMEQYGLPGKIQVSEATYLLLKNKYKFEIRDEIELMGKVKVRPYVLKEVIST
jgi:guanylate cyclase